MLPNKLNYSKLRNCQKKNKSINEDRDIIANDLDTNIDNCGIEDSPKKLYKTERANKAIENKKEELVKVFGDNVNAGNLAYLNSLLNSKVYGEGDNHDNSHGKTNHKKKKGHVRHKSNITESHTKNPLKGSPENREIVPNQKFPHMSIEMSESHYIKKDAVSELLSTMNNKNSNIPNDKTSKIKDDHVNSANITPVGSTILGAATNSHFISTGFSNIGSNNGIGDSTPTLPKYQNSQERLFDQYFKMNNNNGNDHNTNNAQKADNNNNDNSSFQRGVSIEYISNDNQVDAYNNIQNSNGNVFFTSYKNELLDKLDKASAKSVVQRMNTSINESKQENFIDSISQYIDYFIKSEISASYRNIKNQDFYINANAKTQKQSQKELIASQNENKILRHHLEQLQFKLNDIILANKKISHELKEYKTKDEENKKKLRIIEQKLIKISQKKEEYKFKLMHTQELLAKEKIDNENNLLALKKVLSSKMNSNPNIMIRDKDQLYNNGMYMLRKDKEDMNKSKFKDKRIQDNLMIDTKYHHNHHHQNFFKKNNAQGHIAYDRQGLFSAKIGTTSDEDISSSLIQSPSELEASYEQDTIKNVSKDQEIKYLKGLLELIDYNDPHHYQNILVKDAKSSTRNKSKGRIKNYEFGLKNDDIRDKQGSLSKISQNIKIDSRYKHMNNEKSDDGSTNPNFNKSFSIHNSDQKSYQFSF